ncbi:MAG: hypothetical protein P8M56_01080, partial [Flavobacteriaceae bacterium]|nr:hypothetical protein [Flavobacteriaceae bacterium]
MSIVDYVNKNTTSTIQIQNSKFNLKGELVVSDILLSNYNSDTILVLETLKTRYIPLISNSQYDSSLYLEGLQLYFNQKNSEVESSSFDEEILDNLFFDNLFVSNSNLFIVNDSIQYSVDVNYLNVNKIEKNINGVSFDISTFAGVIDNYSIDRFDGKFELKKDRVSFKSFYLSDKKQYLEGDLDFYLNEDFSVNNFNNSNIRFNLNSENFKLDEIILSNFISGEINFSGSINNLIINKALINTDLFNIESKIDIKNALSSSPNVKIDLDNLNFNKQSINSKYKLDNRISYPAMNGNLILDDKTITYKLNQIDESKTKVNINGTAELNDILSYKFILDAELNADDEILDYLNLNSLNINSSVDGTSKQLNLLDSSINIFKNDKEIELEINSSLINNILIAEIDIASENIIINSILSGNTLNKSYKIKSDLDIKNTSNSEFLNFKTEASIEVNLLELENIKSFISLQNIYFKNSNNELSLESFSEINNLVDSSFI